jgi:hypothetical protein
VAWRGRAPLSARRLTPSTHPAERHTHRSRERLCPLPPLPHRTCHCGARQVQTDAAWRTFQAAVAEFAVAHVQRRMTEAPHMHADAMVTAHHLDGLMAPQPHPLQPTSSAVAPLSPHGTSAAPSPALSGGTSSGAGAGSDYEAEFAAALATVVAVDAGAVEPPPPLDVARSASASAATGPTATSTAPVPSAPAPADAPGGGSRIKRFEPVAGAPPLSASERIARGGWWVHDAASYAALVDLCHVGAAWAHAASRYGVAMRPKIIREMGLTPAARPRRVDEAQVCEQRGRGRRGRAAARVPLPLPTMWQ